MTEDRFAKIARIEFNATSGRNETIFRKLTRQEILSQECVKPKFQNPCQPFQSRKCIKKSNGHWKMISCQASALKSLLFSEVSDPDCDCEEKRLQRKFIDKHTSRKLR